MHIFDPSETWALVIQRISSEKQRYTRPTHPQKIYMHAAMLRYIYELFIQ